MLRLSLVAALGLVVVACTAPAAEDAVDGASESLSRASAPLSFSCEERAAVGTPLRVALEVKGSK